MLPEHKIHQTRRALLRKRHPERLDVRYKALGNGGHITIAEARIVHRADDNDGRALTGAAGWTLGAREVDRIGEAAFMQRFNAGTEE